MKSLFGKQRESGIYAGATRASALALAFVVCLLCPKPASAQYTGTGAGTGTMGSGSPSYGSNGKAIGIGVGAAAGGAALLYVAMHHHGSVDGCVARVNDGFTLTDDKSGQTYSLLADTADVKSGERLRLSGKKSKDAEGMPAFEVKKVVKDLGGCQ